jgi:hypothetical protein
MINWRNLAYLRVFKRHVFKKNVNVHVTTADNTVSIVAATDWLPDVADTTQIANNTRLGTNALDSVVDTGTTVDNTAIGINALTALT